MLNAIFEVCINALSMDVYIFGTPLLLMSFFE